MLLSQNAGKNKEMPGIDQRVLEITKMTEPQLGQAEPRAAPGTHHEDSGKFYQGQNQRVDSSGDTCGPTAKDSMG